MTGATAARRPRIALGALGALGAATIVAYGACYYSYGVLIVPIATDTGWSRAGLGTVFSAVLLLTGIGGLLAGRVVDRHGARRLFLLAGVLGAACILLASLQASLAAFAFAYAAGSGLVGALGFYHVTQPTAARLSPAEPARAIIRLTIAGAFAAPAYLPLTGYLVNSIGWRDTLRVDAATVAAAFLFAALVTGRPDANPPAAAPAGARTVLSDAWRSRAVRTWLLVTLIVAAATDTMLLYQVPAMIAAGLTITVAATIAGALGIAQLAGRLPLAIPLARLGSARNALSYWGTSPPHWPQPRSSPAVTSPSQSPTASSPERPSAPSPPYKASTRTNSSTRATSACYSAHNKPSTASAAQSDRPSPPSR